jgi:hypothetical protein
MKCRNCDHFKRETHGNKLPYSIGVCGNIEMLLLGGSESIELVETDCLWAENSVAVYVGENFGCVHFSSPEKIDYEKVVTSIVSDPLIRPLPREGLRGVIDLAFWSDQLLLQYGAEARVMKYVDGEMYPINEHVTSECPHCNGDRDWCPACQMWTSACCVEYGTCWCS